jgi:exo-1,4-beta-D-glucosaminidase
MYWQLYDSFLMPNGAFYGAIKAWQPLHLICDYASDEILASNIAGVFRL